jgi:ketosteroid isomerase-like protein
MSTTTATAATARDVATVHDCLTALVAGDRDAFGARLDENVLYRELNPGGLETMRGREQVLRVADPFVANAADVRPMRLDARAIGPRIEVDYAFGVGPDGRYEIHAFCDVHDGRIAAIDQLCSGHIVEPAS